MRKDGLYPRNNKKEKPPKRSLYYTIEGNKLIIQVSDGKRTGILNIKVPDNELASHPSDIFRSFLERKFGKDIEKKTIFEIIDLLLRLINEQN